MPKPRPVFFPTLGLYFTSLREAKGWNQSQAADMAARRKIDLSYQALRGLEEGKTKNPEPETLRALATLYDVPFEELLATVLSHRYGVAIGVSDVRPGRPPAVSSARATARIQALEARVATYANTVRKMRAPIEKLAALLDAIAAPPSPDAMVTRILKQEVSAVDARTQNRQAKKKS